MSSAVALRLTRCKHDSVSPGPRNHGGHSMQLRAMHKTQCTPSEVASGHLVDWTAREIGGHLVGMAGYYRYTQRSPGCCVDVRAGCGVDQLRELPDGCLVWMQVSDGSVLAKPPRRQRNRCG